MIRLGTLEVTLRKSATDQNLRILINEWFPVHFSKLPPKIILFSEIFSTRTATIFFLLNLFLLFWSVALLMIY